MSDTIELADGTQLDVVDDAADASVVVTGATVSGSRKENLGDYENYEPYSSVRAEFRPAFRIRRPGDEDELRAKLASLRRAVDDHLNESIRNVVEGRQYD